MQKDVKLKYKVVAYERVKVSKSIQALNKAEKDLRHCSYKTKSKKKKLQHTFQIDPDISVD